MATNEVYPDAKKLSLPVPAGVKAGQPVRVGIKNGVAETDRANTQGVAAFNADGSPNTAYNWGGGNPHGYASVWSWGGHTFTVTSAAAPAPGSAVYIDTTAVPATLTTTAGTLKLFGVVVDNGVSNGAGTYSCTVEIVPTSV